MEERGAHSNSSYKIDWTGMTTLRVLKIQNFIICILIKQGL